MDILEHYSWDDRPMGRRSFLKLSGLLGLGVASTLVLPVGAEAVRFDSKTYKVSKTRLAMGTYVSMTLIHSSKDQAEEAMELAFQEVDRLTGLMNRFDPSSPVGCLNKEGRLRDLPPEVALMIDRALHYNRLTHGAFDITVKPVVDLFKVKFEKDKAAFPTERELRQVMTLVGSQKMERKERSLTLQVPGMGITLDGIAKGYIVDRASELLSSHGIEDHLINAGGDIRTVGTASEKKPWTVAIQDPQKRKEYPDVIHMKDGAIATSGNYEVYYDREKMFHHIVDPATGLSPNASTSVSILAKTTTEADALSTSVFVMQPARGSQFIESLPGCECLIIDKKGTLIKSRGWKSTASV